jgi:hypothetical protein
MAFASVYEVSVTPVNRESREPDLGREQEIVLAMARGIVLEPVTENTTKTPQMNGAQKRKGLTCWMN